MPAAIVSKSHDVANALSKIGLSGEQVLEIVHAMAGAKADTTENDPPGAGGWSSWRMGIRRAREVTIHDKRFPDWEKDETGQISSVLNKVLGIRLLVANTDDGTGIIDNMRIPQNRSKKGAATDRIVQSNQMNFYEAMGEAENVIPFPVPSDREQGIVTWYVCVYSDADELRAEVSCPTDVAGGYFSDFRERIIILGGDGIGIDPVRSAKPDGEVVEFDIPVARK
jgi:hypothetical protein